eukprot:2588656-Lingulodinium_polyedra.AAC.1
MDRIVTYRSWPLQQAPLQSCSTPGYLQDATNMLRHQFKTPETCGVHFETQTANAAKTQNTGR